MFEAVLMLTRNRPILNATTLGSMRSSSAIQSLTVTIAIPLTSISASTIHHLDVSALNHESIDDAVECRVIVTGIIDKIEEVLDMLRSIIRVKFDDYFTLDSCIWIVWMNVRHLESHRVSFQRLLQRFSCILETDEEDHNRDRNCN